LSSHSMMQKRNCNKGPSAADDNLQEPNTIELSDKPPVSYYHSGGDGHCADLGNKGCTAVDDRVREVTWELGDLLRQGYEM